MNNNQSPTILVTGGTGFLGSYLLRYLVQRGERVRATKRSSSQMELVADIADAVEWVEVDVTDVIGMGEAFEGISYVYHCAAVVSFDPRDKASLMRTNADGTANVVNWALDKKVKKLVHVSSVAALGRKKQGEAINETTKWEAGSLNTNYAVSKHKAELQVWRGIAEGLNALIINPSTILGAGYWVGGTGGFFTKIYNGLKFCPVGTTGYVDVRDVAQIAIRLMESDFKNERFVVSAENLSYETLFGYLSAALGVPPPRIKVTFWIRELAWRVDFLRSVLTRRRPMITKETATISAFNFPYDNSKIRQSLEWDFIPLQQTIGDTAPLFLQHPTGYGVFKV